MPSPIKRKPVSNGSYSAVPNANDLSFQQVEMGHVEVLSSSTFETPRATPTSRPPTPTDAEHEHTFLMRSDDITEDLRLNMPGESISRSATPKISSSVTVVEEFTPKGLSTRTGSSVSQKSSLAAGWKKPTFILCMLLGGLVLALGHHFYYFSLTGRTAGDENKQAWPIRFGTAFAFLITAMLQAATASAFGQYIWTIVQKKPLTLASLDKLFDLTRDPTGIFSFELLKRANLALLFGLIFWCLSLAGIAPPATLTVIPRNISAQAYVPVLNFSQPAWTLTQTGAGLDFAEEAVPNRIAMQSATGMDVVPLTRPVTGTDWSYDLKMYGPTALCAAANATEQATFDLYTTQLEQDEQMFIYSQVNDTYYSSSVQPRHLIYSAWSPAVSGNAPNAWQPNQTSIAIPSFEPVIWIQTSNDSIVCRSYNASFDLTIASVNGNQQVTQRSVQIIGGYNSSMEQQHREQIDQLSNNQTDVRLLTELLNWATYWVHFAALAEIVVGNYSLLTTKVEIGEAPWQYQTYQASTNMLATGLVGCDEIANGPFKETWNTTKDNWGNTTPELYENTLPSEPWMCRNKSLALAIQDLANNITISYLSSTNLTNNETFSRTIITSNTVNVYQYHALWLVLSYGLAFFFAALATAIGLWAIYANGISHSMSFSAIIAMTRNPELDSLTRGRSRTFNVNGSSPDGSEGEKMDFRKAKLKFGPLLNGELKSPGVGTPNGGGHVAFGFENSVGVLRRGTLQT